MTPEQIQVINELPEAHRPAVKAIIGELEARNDLPAIAQELLRYRTALAEARERISKLERYIVNGLLEGTK